MDSAWKSWQSSSSNIVTKEIKFARVKNAPSHAYTPVHSIHLHWYNTHQVSNFGAFHALKSLVRTDLQTQKNVTSIQKKILLLGSPA